MSEKGRLRCVISSAEKTTTYEGLKSVSLPASSGSMQILPGHAESFVAIVGGDVIMKSLDERTETIYVGASECHIQNDEVVIII